MPIKVCFIIYLIILSVYDVKNREFPGKFLIFGLALALIRFTVRLWGTAGDWEESFRDLGFSIMPGILLLLIAFLSGKIGEGDGCILVLTGMIEGTKNGVIIFAGSLLLASAYSIWILLVRKAHRNDSFPYLPFITASYGIVFVTERMGVCI